MAYDFGPGTVRSGAYECVGGRMEDNINQNYQQIKIPLGSTVNVSFGGVPPYNLTESVFNQDEESGELGSLYCGIELGVIDQAWYLWEVQTIPANRSYNASYSSSKEQFHLVGESVMLVATELNGTAQHRWFNSANFTLTEREIIQTSGASKHGCMTLVLVGLLVLPALFSLQ